MASLLDFIHLLSLSAWVGGLLLLFLVVTPTLHQVLSDDLDRAVSQRVQAAFRPVALACGLGALVSLLALAGLHGREGWLEWRLALLAAMLALTFYAAWVLQPRIDRMLHATPDFDPREGSSPRSGRLLRLQRQAWQTDGTVLLLGLIALWLSAGGPQV